MVFLWISSSYIRKYVAVFFFLGHSRMEMCAQVALLRGGREFLEANWVDSASLISGTGSA